MGFVRWLKLYIRCLFYTISFTIPNSPNTHVFCGQWYTSSPPWRKPGTASQVWCHFLGSLGFGRTESPAHPQHLWLASQDALPSANTHWGLSQNQVSTNCNGLPWFIMVNYDFLWFIIMIYAIFHCQCQVRKLHQRHCYLVRGSAERMVFFGKILKETGQWKWCGCKTVECFDPKALEFLWHSTNKSVDSRFSSVSMPRNIGHTSNHRFYWPKPEDLNQHWDGEQHFHAIPPLVDGRKEQPAKTNHAPECFGGKPNVNYMYMCIYMYYIPLFCF